MMTSIATPGPSQDYSAANEGYTDERFISMMASFWEQKIKPQEFQKMKPEVVQKIYYTFLKDIEVDIERFNEIPPQLIDYIHSPEEYLSSMRLSALSSHMRSFFKQIYNDNSFRLADVFNPKPKRSRKFFGMIYNFLIFTDNNIDEASEREGEVEDVLERTNKMKVRKQKLEQQISERKAENVRMEVSKEEEMRRLKEKTNLFYDYEEEKNNIRGIIQERVQSYNSLKATIKDAELMIMEAKDEVQRLEGLVIQDSEQEEIRKRNEKFKVLKEDNLRRKEHVIKQQQTLKNKTSHKEKIDKFVSTLQEISLLESKAKNLQTTLEQKESETSQFHEKIKIQKEQIIQVTRQQTSAEMNFESMNHASELKQKSLENEIKEQKQVVENIQQKHTEKDIVCKDITDAIVDLQEQIDQFQAKINTTNATVIENCKIILNVIEADKQEFNEALLEIAESLKEFKELAE